SLSLLISRRSPLSLVVVARCCLFFFFQAEDGIRDPLVTGVQTCALPILFSQVGFRIADSPEDLAAAGLFLLVAVLVLGAACVNRSEERRVGKEWRARG